MKIEQMIESATEGPYNIYLDTLLTKEGGGDGEPMQELVANKRNVARFTIYSKLADGYLCESLLNSAPALVALVKAASATVARWDTPLWKDAEPTADVINKLREALAALPEEWK